MRVFCVSLIIVLLSFCTALADETTDLKAEISQYIEDQGGQDNGFSEAVVDVCYGEFGLDPWLWTYIAKFESTWRSSVVGAAGERGWVQIHPTHDSCAGHGVTTNGYSWDNPRDLLRVACLMVQENLDEGSSLYSALSPWTTRSRAWSLYEKRHGKAPTKSWKKGESR